MIQRLLVANRGEIARRVFATCRRLGIETVAVHSPVDAGLPFAAEADYAVVLPGDTPAESYLRIDALLDAATRSGADAIHPGYGFLAESADFARAVLDAGLTWIGPSPASIETMGDKVRAKEIMSAASVPILDSLDPDTLTAADFPVLVKAAAGGGGRGMRVVRDLATLPDELAAARAEADSAFGDGTVFVEPYVELGRHVEVQVWGDHSGSNVSALGARDCSVQRRHQKVVEESPPPGVNQATLEAMYDAARAAAGALGYTGVGTVEFLLDAADNATVADQGDVARFAFLEMNTRLQVEHPVTEAVHGLDLVELQLQAAEDPTVLGVTSAERGHAVEVRLYAEDPAAGYQPQSGMLSGWGIPEVVGEFCQPGFGVRVDAGYEPDSEVSTHYDAMLAKVISWAPTRREAIRQLVGTLRRARIHGLITNRDQLIAVLTDARFGAGEMWTGFLDDFAPVVDAKDDGASVAAALALAEHRADRRRVQRGVPVAWRNVPSQPQRTEFADATVEWWGGRSGYRVDGFGVLSVRPDQVRLERDGVRTSYSVVIRDDHIDVDSPRGHRRLTLAPRFPDPAAQHASGSLLAPMPGTVVSVAAAIGDHVGPGQPVLTLEAMKMQHTVTAPSAGIVAEIDVAIGQQVAAGDVLAVVTEHPPADPTDPDPDGEP